MSKYVWYSKTAADSGKLLAERLDIANHGPLPPAGFAGAVVCWGANYSDKFKWASRDFRGLFNDPRKVAEVRDHKAIFEKLSEAGVSSISCVPLAEAATYGNICNLLAATEEEGFIAAKPNGARSRLVRNGAELTRAVSESCTRAFDCKFGQPSRLRVFVVGGTAVAAIKRTPSDNTPEFVDTAVAEAGATPLTIQDGAVLSPETVKAVLERLLADGLVAPAKSFWGDHALTSQAKRQAALDAAGALGLDFCAVDIDAGFDNHEVINIVTTPDLVNTPEAAQTAIITAIGAWVSENSMTARETLQAMINDADDDEAESLLETLRSLMAEGGEEPAAAVAAG